jgi:hypothetical protein
MGGKKMIKRSVWVAWALATACGIVGCQTPIPLVLSPSDLDQVTDAMVRGFDLDATSKKGKIVKEVGQRYFSDPEQFQLFAGFLRKNKNGMHAVSALLKEGLPNLTDAQLKHRAGIVLTMLERAPSQDCAKLSGSPNYSNLEHTTGLKGALLLLSDEDFHDYMDMNFQAAMARLRFTDAEPVAVSQKELTETLIIIGRQMSPGEQERWLKSLAQPKEVSDEFFCDSNKSMYRSMLTLHGADAKRALRIEFAKIGN